MARDDLRVVDKGRGVGGRMASRRVDTPAGQARFDHGAQFFTTRSDCFVDGRIGCRGWGGGRVDEGFR